MYHTGETDRSFCFLVFLVWMDARTGKVRCRDLKSTVEELVQQESLQ